jgi:hypothetical protein
MILCLNRLTLHFSGLVHWSTTSSSPATTSELLFGHGENQGKLVGPENRQTSDGKKHIQIARVKFILFIGAISFVPPHFVGKFIFTFFCSE